MQTDEVTGVQVQHQKRWEPGDGPNVPFSHIVVGNEGRAPGIAGTAYAVGSLQECRQWQLAHGMRANTQVIPW